MERAEGEANQLIRTWDAPSGDEVGESVEEFLERLGGPAWIRLAGKDASRTRAVSTLLHGNEPSGVRAVHRLLRQGVAPATNVLILVAAVGTAVARPGFAHRMLPGKRDLNRCFAEPRADPEGRLAQQILATLRAARPEALVDIHNTSAAGPAYGIGIRATPECLAITAAFAEHFVLTDLRLGSLMEATADEFPTLTIECGGARDAAADRVAFNGLQQLLCCESILTGGGAREVTVLRHPIRVLLAPDADVAYSGAPVAGRALTLRADIDRFNFTVLAPAEPIGWTQGLGALVAADRPGHDCLHEIFAVREGRLHARTPLRLFMATTDARIAKDDCLFYALPC